MDPDGNIYRDLEEKIPAEDKARLDGYLIARVEVDEKKRLKILEEMTQRETDSGGPTPLRSTDAV